MGKAKSKTLKHHEKSHLQELGRQLKKLRKAAGMSVHDLAGRLRCTTSYIYLVENGRTRPSAERLNQLAEALGDLSTEFLATAVKPIEAEFAARLEQAGLSPSEIEAVARRVGQRAKQDIVAGKEPLTVARGPVERSRIEAAREAGEELLDLRNETPEIAIPAGPATLIINKPISEEQREIAEAIANLIKVVLR